MADNTTASETKIHQLLVTLLESKTLILKYTTPLISVNDIKHRLYEITKIPPFHQRLTTGTRQLEENSVISCSSDSARLFPTVRLTLRLRGGKGGFGSLLRGAATKAGQKKTSNFDACRDMSGRRLRHVNAEKRLEEWKAEEEDRRLEKKAEDFLKKMAKKGKKGFGDGAAEKYVAQYREQSERCVSSVLDSVTDAVKGKRKKVGVVGEAAEAKRLKIWMGKRKLGESDGDASDDSDDEKENEKSTILNRDSDSSKEAEGSFDSVTGGKMSGLSCESGSEEEKEIIVQATKESIPIGNSKEDNIVIEPDSFDEKMVETSTPPCSEPAAAVTEEINIEKKDSDNLVNENNKEEIDKHLKGCGQSLESTHVVSNSDCSLESNQDSGESIAIKSIVEKEKPLNFDEFNSAVELEAFGMERLKLELQTRGLKCGGTLQERAARLFLLKSTPLEKLPKKLLAKKL